MNIQDTTTKQSPNAALPLLELDILRTFVAIAETKSYGQAAEIVHRTPSAVSMQTRKLEEILGQVQNPIGMGLPFRHTRIIGAFVDAFFCQIQKKMDEDGTEENVLNHLETVKAQYRAPAFIESPKFRKFVKKTRESLQKGDEK